MSEYSNGDVAWLAIADGDDVAALKKHGGWAWVAVDGMRYAPEHAKVRPLHVLADDEVAVKADDLREVLAAALSFDQRLNGSGDLARSLQSAVDAYDAARTPQIKEPQGLGAVVEDQFGLMWVRTPPALGESVRPWRRAHDGYWARWTGIKASRVLSEGVRLDEEAGR